MPGSTKQSTFRDRDIIIDRDKRIFVTLGHIQPPDRVLSFLKYIPDNSGKWTSGSQSYRRIFWGGVDSVVNGLRTVPREYLIDDSHFGTELLEIPHENISQHFIPEERLQEIRTSGPSDRLESHAMGLADALHDRLGISYSDIGVAGSILWKGHNPEFSDVNMNIYGFKNSKILQTGFAEVSSASKVRLRKSGEWVSGISRIRERVPILGDEDIKNLFERRFAFYYDDQCIGVTPVLRNEEVPIAYGSESYRQELAVPITVTFQVEDANYGLFSPGIITGQSPPLKRIHGEKVSRLMIYDGVYNGLLRDGDTLEVTGTLQKVRFQFQDVESIYQLMVGTKLGTGIEYIRLKI